LKQELSSSWDGRPYGHNIHGPKKWGGLLCPFPWEDNVGRQCLTQCRLGRGLISVYQAASGSIQPFADNINVTDRQDRETGQTGQRSRSIGRTVTCNGLSKSKAAIKRLAEGRRRVLISLSEATEPALKSATHGQCDERPTVTFPAVRHHRPLTGTNLFSLATEARVCV